LTTLNQKLEQLNTAQFSDAIKNICRGIEREALRISPQGRLSQNDHPKALGSALTHPYITTDYSEALMELITPPSNDLNKTYSQLQDVHKFVLQNLNDEVLWPMSMPCFISDESDIRIAQYGKSNIGKMKTTYRVGLKHRYGSMMQAISGIHYNFSLPTSFWQLLKDVEQAGGTLQDYQSDRYMHMVRNIKRYVWLVTYLFGASPAMCSSFLQGRETGLEFEGFGKGSIFMPNATSLRMSDLGYTNSAQSALNIQYGTLAQYIEKLRQAIHTESKEYKSIGVKVDGEYKQLNHNILQIENELYAPVRPKQVAESGEKPTDALENRGVMYVELRALDVNPFSPYGITKQQMRVLDVFLIYCLMSEQTTLDESQQKEAEHNQDNIVLHGRQENLMMQFNGKEISRTEWLKQIFADFEQIAAWLDRHYGGDDYSTAIVESKSAASDPKQTLSGQLMAYLLQQDLDNGRYGLELANRYKSQILEKPATEFSGEYLSRKSKFSFVELGRVESADSQSFDDFLKDYFNK